MELQTLSELRLFDLVIFLRELVHELMAVTKFIRFHVVWDQIEHRLFKFTLELRHGLLVLSFGEHLGDVQIVANNGFFQGEELFCRHHVVAE